MCFICKSIYKFIQYTVDWVKTNIKNFSSGQNNVAKNKLFFCELQLITALLLIRDSYTGPQKWKKNPGGGGGGGGNNKKKLAKLVSWLNQRKVDLMFSLAPAC